MPDHSVAIDRTSSSSVEMRSIALLLAVAALLGLAFHEGLVQMVQTWLSTEEYSHGLLLPLLAGYLIWQRRTALRQHNWQPHWTGLFIVAIGLVANAMGKLSAVYAIQQYSFVMTLYGLVICAGGWRLLQALTAPMLLLLFMVPLPNFFMNNLSAELQLISSKIGVWCIRAAGISVYLEGNVIDLGTYKLQVAEACSGLRYLFPLMTMGFVMAYLFKAPMWKRTAVFLSSIPLTILMNSLRIGVIGVMVEYWGIAMAEGFLHEFQGWAVFMVTAAIMMLEIVVLSRLGRNGKSWRESFGSLRDPVPINIGGVGAASASTPASIPRPILGALLLLVAAAPAAWAFSAQTELTPSRATFAEFPQQIGNWQGRRSPIEQVYLDVLMLDDYIMADYTQSGAAAQGAVNFYVAWYDSQRAGQSAHSPRSCLPGGGWDIRTIEQIDVASARVAGQTLRVNRVLIENGANKQLVYYWFQQRGRIVTNEYLVKWYLFRDSLTRHRTDGALVRLMIAVPEGKSLEQAEMELQKFAGDVMPPLESHVPG